MKLPTPKKSTTVTKASPITDGLLIVDKPTGWTSHDVVGKLRRIVGQRRIGHAGTLDPGATGVLVVALGRATRLMRFATELPKSYDGEVVLGTTTTTLDNEGEVTATFDMTGTTLGEVQAAAAEFVGAIEQIPPMVSAIKIGGKRLHQLAREGIEVERKPRPVTVYGLEVESTEEVGVFRMKVDCSAGTYIRTLADDIGRALGGGAHLRNLRRVGIGSFTVDQAVTLEQLENDWRPHLLPPVAMVRHFNTISADEDVAVAISHGKALSPSLFADDQPGPWTVIDRSGHLLAVYERTDGRVRAAVVHAAN